MKIWNIVPKGDQFGYLFLPTNDEVEYYSELFNNCAKGSKITGWKPTMICELNTVDIGILYQDDHDLMVLTEHVKELLDPLIGHSVEYLPTVSRENSHQKISSFQQIARKKVYEPIINTVHEEQQFIINLLNYKSTDILDFDKSEFDVDEDDGRIYFIDSLVFYPEKIKDAHIFKIDHPGHYFDTIIFISDEFRKIVEENNLSGLDFIPKHEDYGGNLVWESETPKTETPKTEISQPKQVEDKQVETKKQVEAKKIKQLV